ncbi:MAG: metal-dependent transcriptional regulator [Spirochaetales bacterium]|nr:metal-dependent transcriptional regulator [Spirochaetales bacterium]
MLKVDPTRTKDEYLELLWYMRENGNPELAYFRQEVGEDYQERLMQELEAEGIISRRGEQIALTEKGQSHTRQLIRSHRLAERLVHDVLGVEYEKGACEFEHIINPELVDSICTLLGHPRECPHGMPIPEGECCRRQARTVESSVVPLSQLEIGESARVAYVYARSDQQMHRLENLLIRPGVQLKLHQRRPSYVVECEDTMIALDEEVAGNVHLWVAPQKRPAAAPQGRRRAHRGFRHGV